MRAVVVAVCLSLLSLPGFAQGKPTMAIVDMDVLVRTSIAGDLILKNFQRIEQNYLAAFKKEEQKIAGQQKALREQQAATDKNDKAAQEKLINDFRQTELAARQLRASLDQNIRAIQTDKRKAMNSFQRRVVGVVDQFRQDYGLLAILDTRFVVAAEADIDITQDVLDKINQEMPTVEFKTADQVEQGTTNQ